MLSVICPLYNEEKYIGNCISSILEQDYPQTELEVIFVDGMSTDRTREIIGRYANDHPFIRLVDNPKRIVPCAMNIGIRAARGETIIRIDAHTEFPRTYFSELTRQLDLLGADNVGGVCRTLPVDDTIMAQSIAAVLSSRFGMGNSHFRIGAAKIREVDTVPFGCWHRRLFDRIGCFDEELVRNQDDEFNGRIIRNGGRIFLLPHVVIKYYARDKLSKVWKMFYQYGLFKPLVNKKLGKPATLRQFFPVLFVTGLILGPLLGIISPYFFAAYGLFLLIYLVLAVISSTKNSLSPLRIVVQTAVYFTVHVGYGTGYLYGLYKIARNKPFTAKSNR